MLFLSVFVFLMFTVSVKAEELPGIEEYRLGLEAYNQDKMYQAFYYFYKACDAGYKDGCRRQKAVEQALANMTAQNFSKVKN